MIVTLKLSIPDENFVDVNYYLERLQKLSKDKYPGFIKVHFTGLKGTNSGKTNQKREAVGTTCDEPTVPQPQSLWALR